MKEQLVLIVVVSALASGTWAQAGRVFDLPKFTQPPTLDGVRGPDEWSATLQLECSASQILRDGVQFGWIDLESKTSEISSNMLGQTSRENAAIAYTDADASSQIWQAWDEEGLYYIAEVRDNVRDITGSSGSRPEAWWERDSISLYLDVLNQRTGGDITGEYLNLNIVNFAAAPMNSSSTTVTLETTIQATRGQTQEPEAIEGLEYGFREAGDEFGGEVDYAIEGKISWHTLTRFNLPATPTVGTQMGFSWILLDPDGEEAFGGQLLCWGQAYDPSTYSLWIFSDKPAGPGAGTAIEDNSWGRIKTTFSTY